MAKPAQSGASGNGNARPKLPAHLGNLALKVDDYLLKDNILAVKGQSLSTGNPLTVQLMTAARAANMMKGNNPDERARVEEWSERLANQRQLEEFADPKSAQHVQPGGVLQLNNVRLDFSNRQYYAQSAYGLVSDPAAQAALSGVVSLKRFDNDSIRLQVYQPDNAVVLNRANETEARAAVSKLFDPKSPVGSGHMSRTALVTISHTNDKGFIDFKSFYARSVGYEVEEDGVKAFKVSENFTDTLRRSKLDGKNGPAMAIIAAATGLPFAEIERQVEAVDVAAVISELLEIYDMVADDRALVSMTPGYTVPILKAAEDRISQRKEMFDNGAFPGAVAIAFRRADGGMMDRPAAYSVMSNSVLPKNAPEHAPDASRSAQAAHKKLHNIEFKPREQKAESEHSSQSETRLSTGPGPSF